MVPSAGQLLFAFLLLSEAKATDAALTALAKSVVDVAAEADSEDHPGASKPSRLLLHRLLVDFRAFFIDHDDFARVAGPDVDGDLSGNALGDFSRLILGAVHSNGILDFNTVDNIKMKPGHWHLLQRQCRFSKSVPVRYRT
jgi:hypothetical protein